MDDPIASSAALLGFFSPCFRAEVFGTFRAVVAGWALCPGPVTISEVGPATGPAAKRHHDTACAPFHSATWDRDERGKIIVLIIVARIVRRCLMASLALPQWGQIPISCRGATVKPCRLSGASSSWWTTMNPVRSSNSVQKPRAAVPAMTNLVKAPAATPRSQMIRQFSMIPQDWRRTRKPKSQERCE